MSRKLSRSPDGGNPPAAGRPLQPPMARLRLQRRQTRAASEAAATQHIAARRLEEQSLKALARFAGVPRASMAPDGRALRICGSTSPTDVVRRLEDYIDYRIALARADGSAD